MKEDAFIAGLRAYLLANPALKPSAISRDAGLDVSTVRKLLDGTSTNPTRRTIEAIAGYLGTTAEALVSQSTPERSAQVQKQVGFSDEAVPYVADGATQPVSRLVEDLGKGLAAYQMAQNAPSVGMLKGDVLIINLALPPKPGDLVLIGHSDPDMTTTKTLLRYYHPPFAISSEAGSETPVLQFSDDGLVVWRGTVTSMIRPKIPTLER